MTQSGKRIFSNNQDNTFHDYLSHKKGVEMVKQLKSTNSKIKFLSYNDFTILTKTFSKNSNIIGTDIQKKRSIDDKTVGLIYYEKIINHMKECEYCKVNENSTSSLFTCNSIKNIIYAYENHFRNTTTNVYQRKLDLDRWCKKCDDSLPSFSPDLENVPYSEDPPKVEKQVYCPQNKNRGPGKGRKPIFCSQCDKFIDICLCSNRWGRVDAIRHVNRQEYAEPYTNTNTKPLFF